MALRTANPVKFNISSNPNPAGAGLGVTGYLLLVIGQRLAKTAIIAPKKLPICNIPLSSFSFQLSAFSFELLPHSFQL
jgi:hypothetical protein